MFSWLQSNAPFRIVAHRGASAVAPENTLSAFRQAIADGADAIELDVRLTADGRIVVIHDATLRRTTSGRGSVSSSTLEQLRALDAGFWFEPRFVGEKIPTLEEVFEVVPASIGINVELKSGRERRSAMELADGCCRLIAGAKRGPSVLVTSFHHSQIASLKQRHPAIVAGILLHPLRQSARSPVRIARDIGAEYIVFGSRTLSKRLTRKAHDEGLRVVEYTVNTESRLRRAQRYGVDAIITNLPSMMRRR